MKKYRPEILLLMFILQVILVCISGIVYDVSGIITTLMYILIAASFFVKLDV